MSENLWEARRKTVHAAPLQMTKCTSKRRNNKITHGYLTSNAGFLKMLSSPVRIVGMRKFRP